MFLNVSKLPVVKFELAYNNIDKWRCCWTASRKSNLLIVQTLG